MIPHQDSQALLLHDAIGQSESSLEMVRDPWIERSDIRIVGHRIGQADMCGRELRIVAKGRFQELHRCAGMMAGQCLLRLAVQPERIQRPCRHSRKPRVRMGQGRHSRQAHGAPIARAFSPLRACRPGLELCRSRPARRRLFVDRPSGGSGDSHHQPARLDPSGWPGCRRLSPRPHEPAPA